MNKEKSEKLAKIVWYYNLVADFNSSKQKIVCPFHDDINASLLLDLEEGSWFCFGCNRSGEVFDFVKNMEEKYGEKTDDLRYLILMNKILKSKKVSKIKPSVFHVKKKEST
jgi:DNA primase (bacterial type)